MADVLMLAMQKPDKEYRRIPVEQRYRDELEEAGLSACRLYLEYEVMLLHLLSYSSPLAGENLFAAGTSTGQIIAKQMPLLHISCGVAMHPESYAQTRMLVLFQPIIHVFVLADLDLFG